MPSYKCCTCFDFKKGYKLQQCDDCFTSHCKSGKCLIKQEDGDFVCVRCKKVRKARKLTHKICKLTKSSPSLSQLKDIRKMTKKINRLLF